MRVRGLGEEIGYKGGVFLFFPSKMLDLIEDFTGLAYGKWMNLLVQISLPPLN
jgi:hypothetical protein